MPSPDTRTNYFKFVRRELLISTFVYIFENFFEIYFIFSYFWSQKTQLFFKGFKVVCQNVYNKRRFYQQEMNWYISVLDTNFWSRIIIVYSSGPEDLGAFGAALRAHAAVWETEFGLFLALFGQFLAPIFFPLTNCDKSLQ